LFARFYFLSLGYLAGNRGVCANKMPAAPLSTDISIVLLGLAADGGILLR
jgi:hypothetical protein